MIWNKIRKKFKKQQEYKVIKAQQAQQILETPLFKEVNQDIMNRLFEQWMNSTSEEEREDIFSLIRGLRLIHTELINEIQKVATDG